MGYECLKILQSQPLKDNVQYRWSGVLVSTQAIYYMRVFATRLDIVRNVTYNGSW